MQNPGTCLFLILLPIKLCLIDEDTCCHPWGLITDINLATHQTPLKLTRAVIWAKHYFLSNQNYLSIPIVIDYHKHRAWKHTFIASQFYDHYESYQAKIQMSARLCSFLEAVGENWLLGSGPYLPVVIEATPML